MVLLETSETAAYLKDSPGSFLQLVMVFRVKRQLHCLTTAVVVRDGLVQLDPQDGLQSKASWERPVRGTSCRPVLTSFTCIRGASALTIMFKLKTVVIHRPPQQVDGPPQKPLEPGTKNKRLHSGCLCNLIMVPTVPEDHRQRS